MKFQRNEKYASIAIYACILSALTVTVVMAGLHFSAVTKAIGEILRCFNPLIIGFAVAYLVNPTMRILENKVFRPRKNAKKPRPRLRRVLSLCTAYLFYVLVLLLILALIIPQFSVSYRDLLSQLSLYAQSVSGLLTSLQEIFPFLDTESLADTVQSFFSDTYSLLRRITPHVTGFLGGLLSGMTDAFLGLILSVYFLLYRDRLCAQCRKLSRALFREKTYTRLMDFVRETDVTFGGFIRGKLLDSLIVGILFFFVFALFRIPYFSLVAVFLGVSNIIPFFGPFIGAAPSVLIIFIADPMKLPLFLILLLVVQQIEANVIEPRILGQATGLSALAVIVSITVMGGLFGIPGMFLGVPITALGAGIFRKILHRRLAERGYDQNGDPIQPSKEENI